MLGHWVFLESYSLGGFVLFTVSRSESAMTLRKSMLCTICLQVRTGKPRNFVREARMCGSTMPSMAVGISVVVQLQHKICLAIDFAAESAR